MRYVVVGARSVCSAPKANVDCEATVGARSVCSAPKVNADCEAAVGARSVYSAPKANVDCEAAWERGASAPRSNNSGFAILSGRTQFAPTASQAGQVGSRPTERVLIGVLRQC